ncbi:translation initiation factor IF-2 N-terminal domain-containing protein [Nakamurella lactea]|uniref:translation initiation factor IF-2 N-terminal domain-containing protein n=1 Tax=Nakamurella lactea TaxID=459515 RepID=UPI000400C2CF|nr:translation initiation factor IF-2 N-terminal domain-containing protein [Nakamurella lactea]
MTTVSELAKRLGLPANEVLRELARHGSYPKAKSSRVDAALAQKVASKLQPAEGSDFSGDTGDTGEPDAKSRDSSQQTAGSQDQPDDLPAVQRPAVVGGSSLTEEASSHHPVRTTVKLSGDRQSQPARTPDHLLYAPDNLAKASDIRPLVAAARQAEISKRPILIDLSQVGNFWPNACAPLAAVVQAIKAQGVDTVFRGATPVLEAARVRNPLEADRATLSSHRIENTVWAYFSESQASALADEIVGLVRRSAEVAAGVQESLNLCLYEVLDNVFQHSEAECGFLMATVTGQGKRLALAVADMGIGVRESFMKSTSRYRPKSHFDALTIAVQSGVTSTGDKRGQGLFLLSEMVRDNGGRLELTSGRAYLRTGNRPDGRELDSVPIFKDRAGLFVDWQLDFRNPVNLHDALGGTAPVIFTDLENFENDSGEHVIKIADHEGGTGSRRAASELRNYILNVRTLGAHRLVLDFEGVAMVGASFSDEVVGKLVEGFGIVGFMRAFEFRGMNPTVETLVNRSVELRMGKENPPAIRRPPKA